MGFPGITVRLPDPSDCDRGPFMDSRSLPAHAHPVAVRSEEPGGGVELTGISAAGTAAENAHPGHSAVRTAPRI